MVLNHQAGAGPGMEQKRVPIPVLITEGMRNLWSGPGPAAGAGAGASPSLGRGWHSWEGMTKVGKGMAQMEKGNGTGGKGTGTAGK